MKKINQIPRIQRIVAVAVGMFGLSTLSFNCAPSLFQSADYAYLNQSSTGNGGSSVDTFEDQKLSPWVLQNTGQVFESMSSLTGFSMNVSANQRSEYDARTGALSQTDKLSDINAPLQLGSTSLAGEFCNGIITREVAAGAVRKFFPNVNFNGNPSANGGAVLASSVSAMAQGFWGRAPSAEEQQIINDYYTDFVATSAAQAAQTRNFYLSLCSAMLASFDSITY